MKKIILYLFIFITFFLNSQELKITEYDNTDDYWRDYYEKLEKEITEMSKKNFQYINKIKVWYYCPSSPYFKKYRLITTHEIDNNSFSYGEYRGFHFFGNYYFFKTLDYYKLKYDFDEKTFQYIENYHTNLLKEIEYICANVIICKTRIGEFQKKQVKFIDFYGIYNGYMENYIFSIIFEKECK